MTEDVENISAQNTEVAEETRVCKNESCEMAGQEQPISNFPLNGDRKGGYRWQCKKCMRAINRKWRQANKDRIKQYNKDNRPAKNNHLNKNI